MFICCGEALIDLLPRQTREGAPAFQPFAGGSVFNTAIALGRLGVETGFFGGLSSDFFGDQLREALTASGVDYSLSPIMNRFTITAFVKLVDGQARYVFVDEGSAARSLSVTDLPMLPSSVTGLHFASISLIPEPCGTAFETLCAREAATRVITFDPNLRPGLVKDRDAHNARLRRIAALADIVKLSDEDLAWICPAGEEDAFVRYWLTLGAKVVIVTRGAKGATAYTKDFSVVAPPVRVTVADTVGAGDTFTAGTIAALSRAGLLTKPAIASISKQALGEAITFAARAAAITCSRPGADPPWAKEM